MTSNIAATVQDGYRNLIHLIDIDLWDLQPGSPEAWEAFRSYKQNIESKCPNWVPSEYAVGFSGAKPAFEGERTAVAKLFALMVRACGYVEPHSHEWLGYRWSIKDRQLVSVPVSEEAQCDF